MRQKKPFEMPTITTYRRDELIVETAFTGQPKGSAFGSDRRLKRAFRSVSGQAVLARLLRCL